MEKGIHIFKHLLLTFPLCVSFFIVPVYADEDIYYPDPEQYEAYQWFFDRGYNELMLSDSNGTTYNVNLDNNGTNNGTITGTDTTTGTDHTTGTFNSASSTLGSKYMTCTTNNAVSGTQTYSCYFSSSQSSVSNSQSINIKFNPNMNTSINESTSVNETIKQNINTDITGSITGTETFNSYSRLPWLKGTFEHPTAYDKSKSIQLWQSQQFIIAFYLKDNKHTPLKFVGASNNLKSSDFIYSGTYFHISENMTLIVLKISLKDHSIVANRYVTVDIPLLNNQDVIPYWAGYRNKCPDDVAYHIGLRYPNGQLLDSGNSETEEHVTSADEASTTLGSKFDSYDEVESNMVSNMESSLGNISTDSDLIGNSSFLSSAVWVKQQFDRMTNNTPVGSVLGFSLILGLALIFIGKIR